MNGQQTQSFWRRVGSVVLVLVLVLVGASLALAGFAGVLLHQAMAELPEPTAMRAESLEQDAIIVDGAGNRLHAVRLAHAHREVVPLSAVSLHLQKAVVASEDARFFQHRGFDPQGIARAATQVVAEGRRTGGSTITQQLLKLTLLQDRPTILRKVEELLLAERYEELLTKEQLLELYLNASYFGAGDAGAESASRSLFGVAAADLTVAEAALLVGMLPAPSAYSPFCAPEDARLRQRLVLGRMAATGALEDLHEVHPPASAAEQLRRGDPVRLRLADDAPDSFAMASAVDMMARAWPYESGDHATATLRVPLQRAAHAALQRALEAYTVRIGEHRGPRFVLLSQDSATWRGVLSALRSTVHVWRADDHPLVYDFRGVPSDTNPNALCQYGGTILRQLAPGVRATGIVIAQDETAAMLDLGDRRGVLDAKAIAWTTQRLDAIAPVGAVVDVELPAVVPDGDAPIPVTLVPRPLAEGAVIALDPRDRGLRAVVGGYESHRGALNRAVVARRPIGSTVKAFVYGAAFASGDIGAYDVVTDAPIRYVDPWSGAEWKPANWYREPIGEMTAVEALARSVNTVTATTAFTVGIGRVAGFIETVQFVRPVPREPALSLGALEWSPLELANAYAVLASGGFSAGVCTVDRVERGGHVVAASIAEPVRVLDPVVVQGMDWMLSRVVRDEVGTAHRLDALGMNIRAKTGTTNRAHDAWCVAYTHEMVVAVWVGYDQPRPLRRPEGAESSVTLAVPVAADVFTAARDVLGLTPAPIPVLPDQYLTRRNP